MEFKIEVKKLRESAVIPKIATDGSAAADLYASIDEAVTIAPNGNAVIPTGIAISVPKGYAAFIFARSGLGIKHGITLRNGVGVIDSDYRGEICVGLQNLSQNGYTISHGDRIAQMAIMPVMPAIFVETKELSQTERGDGGLGSTGK